MPCPASISSTDLLTALTERLALKPLQDLAILSDGSDDFLLGMVERLYQLLTAVYPRMAVTLENHDFLGLALEAHKLRAAVGYLGAIHLEQLASVAEPLLRAHDGLVGAVSNRPAEALARELIAETGSLLNWLDATLQKLGSS